MRVGRFPIHGACPIAWRGKTKRRQRQLAFSADVGARKQAGVA